MSGLIQGADLKTEAELIAAGADKTYLPRDTQIYITAKGINETLDDAITLGRLGGGGGASGLDWNTDEGAALEVTNGVKSYSFAPLSDLDGAQVNKVFVKVPETYAAGTQIKLYLYIYSESTSGTNLIQTNTYLVRAATDAMDSTTNYHASGNSAVSVSGTSKVPQKITLNLTDASGEINSVAVSASDLLRIELERGTDTDTGNIEVLMSMEISFN